MLQTEESIMLLHVSGGVVSLKHQVVVFPGIYTQIHLILLRVTKLQAVKQSGKLSPEYGSYKINFIHHSIQNQIKYGSFDLSKHVIRF